MTYDYAVLIGRFQPLHIGHQHIIDEALRQAEKLIVLIGSADTARSIRNPFTYDERAHFLSLVYRHEIATGKIIPCPVPDRVYNDDAWIAEVQRIVDDVVDADETSRRKKAPAIALAGYNKDGSSYYLKMFPAWGAIDLASQHGTFSSTDVRDDFFRRAPRLPHDLCAPPIVEALKQFRLTPEFAAIVAEREFVESYKAAWASAPHPPTFVTVDAVVVQSGHVLLVRRGEHPGKGLFAIPGGFVNQGETLRAAVLRELREETGIADAKGAIPPAMLASFIDDTATRVFDAPERSLRGRVITHAFKFRCPDRRTLFKVKGGDDAASAAWYRLGDLAPSQFFEDHWSILETMIGI